MYTFLTQKSCITLYKTLKYDLVLRTTMFLLTNWLFIYVSRGQELVVGPTNKWQHRLNWHFVVNLTNNIQYQIIIDTTRTKIKRFKIFYNLTSNPTAFVVETFLSKKWAWMLYQEALYQMVLQSVDVFMKYCDMWVRQSSVFDLHSVSRKYRNTVPWNIMFNEFRLVPYQ